MATTTGVRGRYRWVQVPATWKTYLRLSRAKGDRYWPKYVYCDGRLTAVSPSPTHEFLRDRVPELVKDILFELRIAYHPSGSTTFKRPAPEGEKGKGVEADAGFYLSNIARVRGKKTLVMGVDPPPDLQIEIVVPHPVRDALKVHAALGVREVWVCKASGITFLILGDDGRYRPSPTSACLPFLSSDELAPWVFRTDFPDETTFRIAFRDWVRGTLVPRLGPAAAEGGGAN